MGKFTLIDGNHNQSHFEELPGVIVALEGYEWVKFSAVSNARNANHGCFEVLQLNKQKSLQSSVYKVFIHAEVVKWKLRKLVNRSILFTGIKINYHDRNNLINLR